MARVPFVKVEGLGNDFVLIEHEPGREPPLDVPAVCDRHRGVGADGVLFVSRTAQPGCDARMRIVNADGSVPEMCGNGARCVALHLARRRGEPRATIVLDTDAGPRACVVRDEGGAGEVEIDMGVVRVGAERTLDAAGTCAVTPADAGNPHAVLFGDFDAADLARLGPPLSTHPAFPAGANVELVRVGPEGLDVLVWERGVGPTLACGTGACAAAAVACARGTFAVGRPLRVRLPGGALVITVGADGGVRMKGPARQVFEGALDG